MALPTITNTNPLGESSWNIYRSADGGTVSLLTNITAPAWQPGTGQLSIPMKQLQQVLSTVIQQTS